MVSLKILVKKLVVINFLLLLILSNNLCFGQDRQEFIINKLNETWKEGILALNKGKYFEANQHFDEVNKLRLEGGFESLEEYSLILLSEADRRLQENNIDLATFILKKALLFSPANPEVLFKSLVTVNETGLIPLSKQLGNFFQNFSRIPRFLFRAINNLVTPIICALTVAVYLVCILYSIYHFKTLCASISPYLQEKYRINHAPFIVAGILILPVFFGPIWCIVAWTLLIHISSLKKQLFTPMVALIIISWGVVFPFSECINSFLNHEGVKSIMRVTENSLSAIDYGRFRLIAEQKPNDPVIWFSYGQFLRKSGRLDEAFKAFERFDEISPARNETKLQKGMIYYLKGDSKNAKALYDEVIQAGLMSPGIGFNYSKILFDELSTTESQKYYKSAMEQNSSLIGDLRTQEERIGRQALAEIGLPVEEIVDWGLSFVDYSNPRVLNISNKLALFGSPYFFVFLGIVLLIVPIFIKPKKSIRFIEALYQEYEHPEILEGCFIVLPGGGYLIDGDVSKAFLCLSVISLSLLCLIGWPGFFSEGIYFIPFFHVFGAFSFLILWLSFCYHGFSKIENITRWRI